MKKLAILFALAAFFAADVAFANATATSVTGSVQAQSGSAAARPVRQGDVLRQGDTISTGPASSVVMRFEDGQIAGLTANSRMTITTYNYNAQTGGGSVLLSLVGGGMRAISGLIAKASPRSVSYKAATATIGIRGTDTNIVLTANGVLATVNDGSITFATPGKDPVVINTGEAIIARPDGTFSQGAIQQIANQLAQTPAGQQILDALNGLQGLTVLLGQPQATGTATGLVVTPGPPPGGSSSAGGGGASAR